MVGGLHGLARDKVSAEKTQELDKARVAHGLGDGQVKREVLLDRSAALVDGLDERLMRPADRCLFGGRRTLRGERRGFHLDGEPQFHHRQRFVERVLADAGDAEGDTARILRHERARSLAGDDQPFRLEGGDGLAHHRPRDAHGRHEFLLRRQAIARRQDAPVDFRGDPVDDLRRPVALRCQRPQQAGSGAGVGHGETLLLRLSYKRIAPSRRASQ